MNFTKHWFGAQCLTGAWWVSRTSEVPQSLFLANCSASARKRIRQRSRGVDFGPFDPAQRECLLLERHRRIGIGGIETPRPNAIEPGLKVGDQEQPAKGGARRRRNPRYRRALLGPGKHRIDDRRMARADHTGGLVGHDPVNLAGDLGAVSIGWKVLGFRDAKEPLALDVGPNHQSSRSRRDKRGQFARQR